MLSPDPREHTEQALREAGEHESADRLCSYVPFLAAASSGL
jgi:hypothetical protein